MSDQEAPDRYPPAWGSMSLEERTTWAIGLLDAVLHHGPGRPWSVDRERRLEAAWDGGAAEARIAIARQLGQDAADRAVGW